MYDVLGSWDLIIKLRSKENEIVIEYYNDLITILKEKGIVSDNDNDIFGRKKLINITKQVKTIQSLTKNLSENIIYTVLEDGKLYDDFRANRTFIYVQLPDADEDKKSFLKELIKKINNKTGTEIIESICKSDQELIFETFSSCSRTSFVFKLNQLIDPVIAIYKLQKYTLTCYYHDERGLLEQIEKP